jgi:LuxR family transcriptional regulator, maltose regulon positive regulatory protein
LSSGSVKEFTSIPPTARVLAAVGSSRSLELPPLPSLCIERAGLIHRLIVSNNALVSVLTAPLGFGKTTVLLQLAARLSSDGYQVAWLSLRGSEREPKNLLRALEKAFGFDPNTSTDNVAALLARIDAAPRAVLCIDNLDALSPGDSLDIIAALIDGLKSCRLFVAGRTSGELKLSRLTLAGRVRPVKAQDLAFDEAEVRSLSPGLSNETAERVVALTEGWPVAIGAMLSAEQNVPLDFDETAVPPILVRYFEENVLDDLGEDERRMLMDAAIFERFTPVLLAELPRQARSGKSDLATLVSRNLPIEAVDELSGFERFFKPFQSFLRQRLQRLDPARCLELHRFAADWFERRGQVMESIRHAALCRDAEVTAGVMERANAFRLSLHQGMFLTRIEPVACLRSAAEYPLLTLCQIYLTAQEGRIEEARAHFDQLCLATQSLIPLLPPGRAQEVRCFQEHVGIVLDAYEDRPVEPALIERLEQLVIEAADRDPIMVATTASLLAPAYLSIGRPEAACNMADMGLASLRGIQADPLSFYLEIQQTHAVLALGRVREASLHVDRAQALARRAFGPSNVGDGIVNISKAVVHYEVNELEAAERLLSSSLHRDVLSNGWFELYAEAISAAADTAAVLHGAGGVDTVLADALIIAAQRRLPRLASLVAVLRLRCATEAGNLPYAVNLMQGHAVQDLLIFTEVPISLWNLKLRTLALLESARLFNALGRAREAALQLAMVDRRYIETGDARVRFTYYMLAMEATFQLHRNEEATSFFCDGMNLALECGLVRRLLSHRRQILEVFDWMFSSGRPISSRIVEFCGSALRSAGDADSRLKLNRRLLPGRLPAPPVATSLTQREAEILAMIAEGLSTKEIAGRISVSTSTVKTHRKNLFEKLGVARRSQAIAIAREKMII